MRTGLVACRRWRSSGPPRLVARRSVGRGRWRRGPIRRGMAYAWFILLGTASQGLYKVSVYMNASSAKTTAYDFTATDIDGRARSLSEFAGQALLIVNVASKCGFTP